MLRGEEAAREAEDASAALFYGGSSADSVPVVRLSLAEAPSLNVLDMAVRSGVASSKAEARRLVQQGGLYLDEERVAQVGMTLTPGRFSVRAGKRKRAVVEVIE